MAYATVQDAIDLYGESYVLTSVDRDKDGKVDNNALKNALKQASSLLDSYIGFRYVVPVSPVPQILKKFTIDIAIYESSPGTLARTKEKRERFEDAIKWAKDVSAGKAAIVVAGNVDPEPEQVNEPEISVESRVMTRSKLSNLI